MHSILAPIKKPWTTSQKKLSKQNLETLQDYIRSHPLPDSVSEWIPLSSAMAGSNSAGIGAKKRKAISTLRSITEIGGHKYSPSYTDLLYRIGITLTDGPGIIPPVAEDTEEVRKHFPEPNDFPSFSNFIKSRFEKFQPNEVSLVHFLCECLFPLKVSTPGEDNFAIILEFPGPFKSHNLKELLKGDEGIKYSIVKRNSPKEESQFLQTPAEEDLRSRSDFVFAASADVLGKKIRKISQLFGTVPCVSNGGRTCAVAIVAGVKATASPTSLVAARDQWSSLVYLQIMERVSIRREAYYVGDEDICQYGYCICGLNVTIFSLS